jgi:hypothetical protein
MVQARENLGRLAHVLTHQTITDEETMWLQKGKERPIGEKSIVNAHKLLVADRDLYH